MVSFTNLSFLYKRFILQRNVKEFFFSKNGIFIDYLLPYVFCTIFIILTRKLTLKYDMSDCLWNISFWESPEHFSILYFILLFNHLLIIPQLLGAPAVGGQSSPPNISLCFPSSLFWVLCFLVRIYVAQIDCKKKENRHYDQKEIG